MTGLPEKTRLAQEHASDPAVSAWVSANAGSGKTTVLVRRAIRLMMAGTPPARILCLTYTKAAAAHMANEVLRVLSQWVRLDDVALDKKLAEVDPAPISDARRTKARQLFAAALETPGGLKVQTIHAFCDRVLHQFPFEARVPAGFEVLEGLVEQDFLARARLDVLMKAASERDGDLGRALARAVAVASDQGLAAALDEAVRERRELQRFFEHHGANADAAIAAALGLQAKDTLANVEKQIVEGRNLPRAEWPIIAKKLHALDGNARKRGEALAAAAAGSDPAAAIEDISRSSSPGMAIRARTAGSEIRVRAHKSPIYSRVSSRSATGSCRCAISAPPPAHASAARRCSRSRRRHRPLRGDEGRTRTSRFRRPRHQDRRAS